MTPKTTTTSLVLLSAALALGAHTASAYEPGSNGRVMWETNCDFYGADIYSVNAKSERCGDICADETRCSHWAWSVNGVGGTCWLKSGGTNAKVSAPSLTCGYVVGRFNPNASSGTTINFQNKCAYTINLYDNKRTDDIVVGGSTSRQLQSGFSGMFRHGANDQATLAEMAIDGGRLWYDISVIPPGSGSCTSYDDCKRVTSGKKGYNVPMAMVPADVALAGSCRTITCTNDRCPDAYIFPSDNSKTHDCPASAPMTVVFCP